MNSEQVEESKIQPKHDFGPTKLKTKETTKEKPPSYPDNVPSHQHLESEARVANSETRIAIFGVSSVIINDLQELDEKVRSMMAKSENTLPNGPNIRVKADICTVFWKRGQKYQHQGTH